MSLSNVDSARYGSDCTALVVNPTADHYGSDLQLLEAVEAMTEHSWRVVAVVSEPGELVGMLERRGAEVRIVEFPVLRRAYASFRGIAMLSADVGGAIRRMRNVIKSVDPDIGLVNTTTLPWWLVALRTCRVPTVCYVHEAEANDGRLTRIALSAPLMLSQKLIVISNAARDALLEVMPRLEDRMALVHNGVPDHEGTVDPPDMLRRPTRLGMVARVSPRKGTDTAIEALAILRDSGHDVELNVFGTPFAGYEWFEDSLRERCRDLGVEERVHWRGYVRPSREAFLESEIVIAPSRAEPFGNSVVEAQLARRPVVVSNIQGHLETVVDGSTGLHFERENPHDLARTIGDLLSGPDNAVKMGERGRMRAIECFSTPAYRTNIMEVMVQCTRPRAEHSA